MRRIVKSYFNYYYKNKIQLIHKIINNFRYRNADELLSIAKNELLYSMIHFNKELGSFNSYLFLRIRGNILRYIRDEKKWLNDIDVSEMCIKDSRNIDLDKDLIMEDLFKDLSEKERNILDLHYLQGNTIREIAKKMNTSTCTIMKGKNKAIQKIREMSCL